MSRCCEFEQCFVFLFFFHLPSIFSFDLYEIWHYPRALVFSEISTWYNLWTIPVGNLRIQPFGQPGRCCSVHLCLLLVYFLKKRRWRVILTTGLYAISPHSPSKPKTQEQSSTFTDFHWSAQLSNTLYWMGNEWGAENTSRLIDFNFLKQLSWCGFELLFANLQHPKTATNVLSR